MYESTLDTLFNVFEFIPLGGFIIFDEVGLVEEQKAVKIFWEIHGLDTNFVNIDNSGVYWVKNANPPVKWEWYEDFNSTKRAETY